MIGQTQKRYLLFGRRLLNKPFKKQSSFKHNYDPADYMVAMKKFHLKTRGMIRDSEGFDEIRNQIYAELRHKKATQNKARLEASKEAGTGYAGAIDDEFKAE